MPEIKQTGVELLPRESVPVPEVQEVTRERPESTVTVDVGRVERSRTDHLAKASVASSHHDVEIVAPEKDTVLIHVEEILADGLGQLYATFPAEEKQKFKKKGEETANDIAALARQGKAKTHRILNLIRGWLLLIPAVNKFFLEQEVKIKTDRVLILAEDVRKNV